MKFSHNKKLPAGMLCNSEVWIEGDVCIVTRHDDTETPSRKDLEHLAKYGLERAGLGSVDTKDVVLKRLERAKAPEGRSYHIARAHQGQEHLSGVFIHAYIV